MAPRTSQARQTGTGIVAEDGEARREREKEGKKKKVGSELALDVCTIPTAQR